MKQRLKSKNFFKRKTLCLHLLRRFDLTVLWQSLHSKISDLNRLISSPIANNMNTEINRHPQNREPEMLNSFDYVTYTHFSVSLAIKSNHTVFITSYFLAITMKTILHSTLEEFWKVFSLAITKRKIIDFGRTRESLERSCCSSVKNSQNIFGSSIWLEIMPDRFQFSKNSCCWTGPIFEWLKIFNLLLFNLDPESA